MSLQQSRSQGRLPAVPEYSDSENDEALAEPLSLHPNVIDYQEGYLTTQAPARSPLTHGLYL